MKRQKIMYRNWIVELGRDPLKKPVIFPPAAAPMDDMKIAAVREALGRLTPNEAGFIRLFYLQGLSYGDIAAVSGREIYKLEALHSRAVRKLAGLLRNFLPAEAMIGFPLPQCPLCAHPEVEKINELIAGKSPKETWKRINRELKTRFGLRIATPQQLIGHQKYHMWEA